MEQENTKLIMKERLQIRKEANTTGNKLRYISTLNRTGSKSICSDIGSFLNNAR